MLFHDGNRPGTVNWNISFGVRVEFEEGLSGTRESGNEFFTVHSSLHRGQVSRIAPKLFVCCPEPLDRRPLVRVRHKTVVLVQEPGMAAGQTAEIVVSAGEHLTGSHVESGLHKINRLYRRVNLMLVTKRQATDAVSSADSPCAPGNHRSNTSAKDAQESRRRSGQRSPCPVSRIPCI